ncbi:MAG: biopolymer transporter ExbD [Verrucomicrobiota bacterium]|jgi:biopolymer transport protein ExbD|nr:biopolymer transporter ExbD [Verrucomicrobiota bacterium]
MRSRKVIFDEQSHTGDINVSPLIDIVFILLIFFIVTTVFVEETGVEVQKPRATSANLLEKSSILIAITANGQIVYDGQEIGLRGVGGVVKRLLKKTNMPVIIQADRKAPIDLYAKVHDEASLAGAKQINLATK